MKKIFVTGIGPGVGKTVVSAVLVEKLAADYWKPVQSGNLLDSDTETVKKLVTHKAHFFKEAYRLTQPFSPHKSAQIDGVNIQMDKFKIPQTENNLVIEGAGGLMVPLNEENLVLDLIKMHDVETIIVSCHYLGSINHTLLTVSVLKEMKLPVAGIIFNGTRDIDSEMTISRFSGLPVLGHIPEAKKLDRNFILRSARLVEFNY